MKFGVLALQGAFREHKWMLERCGVETLEVRKAKQLDGIAGLILPGGESTTIGKMMNEWGLMEKIKERVEQGMAIFGTCAGVILLSKEIIGSNQPRLGLMNTVVLRNGYGRQIESFEADLQLEGIEGKPVKSIFIRAPLIEETGAGVAVMGKADGRAVAVRQGKIICTTFHPELTDDDRIHRYFIRLAKE